MAEIDGWVLPPSAGTVTLDGRRLAYIGDGNNVTASLAYAAALSGVELAVATPPGYELDDLTVERVPGGHFVPEEAPDELVALLTRFV